MSNTTHWSEDPSVTGTEDFANQINDMLNEQEAKGIKVDRESYNQMYNIPAQYRSIISKWNSNSSSQSTTKTD